MSFIGGYVCQKEYNFEDLTVYEHMKFMARLKMDRNMTDMDRHQNILNIVKSLSLSHRLQATIHSLSGGQKKRLTLAVQLLTEPKILFCDEPTTGLDSYSAEQVVRLLRSLANDGKMVICSIHQPASGIFENFDDATLLASGGKMAYHGPVASINSYFSENSVPFHTELGWLFWRASILYKHTYKASLLPFVAYLMVFLVVSIPYYGIIKANQEGVQNMIGFLNIFTTQVMYSALSSVVNVVPEEMPVFIQETTDGVYSPVAFYVSKACFMLSQFSSSCLSFGLVVSVFIQTSEFSSSCQIIRSDVSIFTVNMSIQEIIFMSFALTITGLNRTLSDYVTVAVPTLLLTFTSVGYGFFLSSAFKSVDTYSLFGVPFEICAVLLTGLSLKLDSMPWYSAWLKYLSFPYYAYESLNIIEWAKFSHISKYSNQKPGPRFSSDLV
ncbi:hypothetical protein V9T40_000429 [Parthenolecanium corni]|uniref:Uncharacterized protein n=1 Tax=Parthenolecanium corni TaxID=536013 RepID=A0AAN9TBK3_9HEMI